MKKMMMLCSFLFSLHMAISQGLVAPFSGQRPSENYLRAMIYPNGVSQFLDLQLNDRELLFAPFPEPDNTAKGRGRGVGEAPVADCLRLLILCGIGYGAYGRRKNKVTINNNQ